MIPLVPDFSGKPNPAGFRMLLYLIDYKELTSTPNTKPYNKDAPGEDLILDGDFGYINDDVHFTTIPIVVDSGELVNAMVGNIGSQAFNNELSFYIPTTLKEHLSFASSMVNKYVVAAITDRNNQLRIMGRHDDPAYLSEVTITQGKKQEDDAGGQYKLICGTGILAPIFTGQLRLPQTFPS